MFTSTIQHTRLYAQLAVQEVSATHRSLMYRKKFASHEIGANCGELASLLLDLYMNLCDADEGESGSY